MSGGPRPTLLVLVAFLIALSGALRAVPVSARTLAEQLKARGVRDARVLEAFNKVRREDFVPLELRDRASADEPLPIGHGQTISEPSVVARMTELLSLRPEARVLEVGTGSGYQAAILAELARDVCSVEIIPALAASARLRLTRLGYRNVHVRQGDGAQGWPAYGPYDAIVVTAAAPRVPPPLIEQLVEGGVLVLPVGSPGGRQVLVRGVKRGFRLYAREIAEVRFVPLVGGGGAAGGEGRGPLRREAVGREPTVPEAAPAGKEERGPRGEDAPRERDRPQLELREEDLPQSESSVRDQEAPESDRRSRPGAPGRAARVRAARGSDRPFAGDAAARAAACSRAAAPRCAG